MNPIQCFNDNCFDCFYKYGRGKEGKYTKCTHPEARHPLLEYVLVKLDFDKCPFLNKEKILK